MAVSLKNNWVVLLVSVMFVITGCTPTIFGMPEDQFNQLSPEQQQQVIDSYNKRLEIEQQNKPKEHLIDVLGSAIATKNAKSDSQSKTDTKSTTTKGPMNCHYEGTTQVCSQSSSKETNSSSSGTYWGVGP